MRLTLRPRHEQPYSDGDPPTPVDSVWEYDHAFDHTRITAPSLTQPGQLPYIAFTEWELLKLAIARNLAHKIPRITKGALVFTLEDADANPVFHKWSDLAPELRLFVYEHHFRDLGKAGEIIGSHEQPAITRTNRKTRKESLKLFYTTKVFVMKWSGLESPRNSGYPSKMGLKAESAALLKGIPKQRFNSITNFVFTIEARKVTDSVALAPPGSFMVLDLVVNIAFKADGSALKVKVMNKAKASKIIQSAEERRIEAQTWFEQMLAAVLSRPQRKRWRSSDFEELCEHFRVLARDIKLR